MIVGLENYYCLIIEIVHHVPVVDASLCWVRNGSHRRRRRRHHDDHHDAMPMIYATMVAASSWMVHS